MEHYPKIGIVYLLFYHNESYVDDMVSALQKMTYPKDRLELIIVCNPHPADGSFGHYIESTVLPLSGNELPHTTLLYQKENIGFASGNNVGATLALEKDCEYVFFHNNDGFLDTGALEPLVRACDLDTTIGMAQSLILLHPETDLVNSAGNSFHYLGFGFSNQYRVKVSDLALPAILDIDYASGAGLLVRSDLIRQYGGWDDDFFLYHEDLEWSLRLRSMGYRIVLVRDSVFYHKFQFGRSIEKFFYMERNRHAVMLMFFKVPTLILLLPMALVLEIGLWIFAFKNGYAHKRLDVYRYWLKREHWKIWLKKRTRIQRDRVVSDRVLLRHSVAQILFQEEEMQNPLLTYIGNPIMRLYHWVVVKLLIHW